MNFNTFLSRRIVLKRGKDLSLMKSLAASAKDRLENSQTLKSKYRFEFCYDAVRELSDALLARDGFKTYSHEASLSYPRELSLITQVEHLKLDHCRQLRNDLKYYGVCIDDGEAIALSEFLHDVALRIERHLP